MDPYPSQDDPWSDDPRATTGDDPWANEREAEGEPLDEITYTLGRDPGSTYWSRTFDKDGEPAKFVWKTFDQKNPAAIEPDGHVWVLRTSPGGRSQVKFLVRGDAREITDIWVTRIQSTNTGGNTRECIHFDGHNAARLIETVRGLDRIPIDGGAARIDDALMRDLLTSPADLAALYRKDPETVRRLITDDTSARDVIAVAHRREQVAIFRRLLEDRDYFDQQVDAVLSRRPEDVWQAFFEANPWILGISLTGQLLTSWSSQKLEQVVAGRSVKGAGKRTDALMRTSGRIRSLVFAEFKTHTTPLLDKEYRPGCYGPSKELTGGVTQLQGTVHRALLQIEERLESLAPDGSEIPDGHSYLIRPRSYLVIGTLDELRGEHGGVNTDQFRSFELYRRNTVEPEIVTYDEILARAEWHIADSAA